VAGTVPIASTATPGQDLKDRAVYMGEKLDCDVVMKGGITSGVTYPWAICEIAKKYHLRSIGGTSAGAIAAATAAAAEFGREDGGGFPRLAELPTRLSRVAKGQTNSTLFNLFQPQPGTAPFFNLLKKALEAKGDDGVEQKTANEAKPPGRVKQVTTVLGAALRSFWAATLAGAAPGLAIVVLSVILLATDSGVHSGLAVFVLILAIIAGLVLAMIGGIGATLLTLVRKGLQALPVNGFGLCSGFTPEIDGPPSDDPDLQPGPGGTYVPKPLTTWLADELDIMAGKTPSEPLTLGDLCDAGMNLKMFTTCLTEGTPYTLPFKNRRFFFAPKEFDQLFPKRIVRWMLDHPTNALDEDERTLFDQMAKHDPPLVPLPECQDFPVVLATRMSLSFPILMSAIPLWAIDYRGAKEPARCWFSDGGITSNFPVHFFDSPLPRWPTFGINVGPMPENERNKDQSKNLDYATNNRQRIRPRWRGISTVPLFVHAVLDTMQNWLDNAQTHTPGYRDRIVTIKHTDREGGLNLNMPEERIIAFSQRGQAAGRVLVNRFSGPQSTNPDDRLSWDNHRWVRYRSFMALLDTTFERLLRGYGLGTGPSGHDYAALIDAPPSYRWCSEPQHRAAVELTASLTQFARSWSNLPPGTLPDPPPCQCDRDPEEGSFDRRNPFECGAPHPRPMLRVYPDF
jgi:hypothetical protein